MMMSVLPTVLGRGLVPLLLMCSSVEGPWIDKRLFKVMKGPGGTESLLAQMFPHNALESNCPVKNARILENPSIAWNVPYRAFKTLPQGLRIEKSSTEGDGLGVFSDSFLKAYIWLGEYEGEICVFPRGKPPNKGLYTWETFRGGYFSHFIDASNLETSGWLRWLNSPRTSLEENVVKVECRGRILYLTIKDIYPGQELLVYYGYGYAGSPKANPNYFQHRESTC